MHINLPVALADVRDSVLVEMLLIVPPMVCGVGGMWLVLVLCFSILCVLLVLQSP